MFCPLQERHALPLTEKKIAHEIRDFIFLQKILFKERKRERKRKESEITVIATHFIPWQSHKIQTRFLSLFQVQKFPSKIVLKKKNFFVAQSESSLLLVLLSN